MVVAAAVHWAQVPEAEVAPGSAVPGRPGVRGAAFAENESPRCPAAATMAPHYPSGQTNQQASMELPVGGGGPIING